VDEKKLECSGSKALDPAFERLAERAFKLIVSEDPVRASWLGIHGRSDLQLPDRSAEAEQAGIRALKQLLSEFEAIDGRRLAPVQCVDLVLARGALSARVAMLERHPVGRVQPRVYLEDAVCGSYVLILHNYAPAAERAQALLGRLKAIPGHLRRAEVTLQGPPAIFTEAAVLTARGAEEFFRVGLPEFLATLKDAALQRQCERAGRDALRAVERFTDFLTATLMPRSNGEFRVGKALFNRILREQHMLPFDADELVILGEKIYHETLREVRRTAARIRPGQNWSRLLEEIKEDHPEAQELVESYVVAIQASRAFVRERELLTLPEGEALQVAPTPGFARPFHPYGGYVAPAALEPVQTGTLWITPVDPAAPPERRSAILRGHPRLGIPVLAMHEGYPGHHVQLTRANRTGRPLRMLFTTPIFAEGWALYSEEMMYRAGFYRDDRIRLLQLSDQLWRACRVIVDVGLHTGAMTFNEAVHFLVRKAKLERPNAIAEVRRYCAHPTHPMCYIAGKLLLDELLQDYRRMKGDACSLRDFHDQVLSHGTIPIELIRREMDVPRNREEKEILRALSRTQRGPRGSRKAKASVRSVPV
jgi:uncharacterized protein (DUF885 family)